MGRVAVGYVGTPLRYSCTVLAASMRAAGLLDQDGQRDRYRLGVKLCELGNRALANMDLHREARPFVDALSQICGHVVNISVFDGRQAIVTHRVSAAGGAQLTMVEAAPVHCTATAILAFQPPSKIDEIISAGLKRFTDNTITHRQKLVTELKLTRGRG